MAIYQKLIDMTANNLVTQTQMLLVVVNKVHVIVVLNHKMNKVMKITFKDYKWTVYTKKTSS